MRNTTLNIKTIDNKFLITVDKKQITPDYILELLNWLQYQKNLFSSNNIDKEEKKERDWNYAGCVNLNHKIDNINLRDFAHE